MLRISRLWASTRTIQTSSLGKHVIATHLCIRCKVGFWISLQHAPPEDSVPVMDSRKLSLWNPLKERLTSTKQRWWKPKWVLKSFQVKEYFWWKNWNVTPSFVSTRVQRNWIVKSWDPNSETSAKEVQPTAFQILVKSTSIPVFSTSSSSKPRVWLKTLFFQHVVGLILVVPLDDEVGIVGRLSLWCWRSLLLWRLGLHLLSVGFCWRIIHAWRRGREVVDVRPLPRTTWTPHLLECTDGLSSELLHSRKQGSTRTHNNSKWLC